MAVVSDRRKVYEKEIAEIDQRKGVAAHRVSLLQPFIRELAAS